MVPIVVLVGTIVFLLIHLTPGDPAVIMLGPDAPPKAVAQLRAELGLDAPLYLQWLRWFQRVLAGDLGKSIFFGIPVTTTIRQHLVPTVLLSLLAILIAVGIGVPAGIISAARRGSAMDQAVTVLSFLGVSIPEFWLALNLVLLLAVHLGLFPVAGYAPPSQGLLATLNYLVLPAFTMGFVQSALIARMTRTAMLDVITQDYIRTARAKGLPGRRVTLRHTFPNALIAVITVVGIVFSVMMGGNVVAETIFTIPGIGQLLFTSVLRRDYPVIQGIVLLIAVTYVVVNLLVDLAYALVDPRVRY
ncbi:MAG: peptide ABC transporter [Armatimonadetes bacterium RBG_16_67_12]|nr:MAG: peptide ABC transporter [Armatimonadetes bacterium RBG_16_67_12]